MISSALFIPILFFSLIYSIFGSSTKDISPCKVKKEIDLKCSLIATYIDNYPVEALKKFFSFLNNGKIIIRLPSFLAAEGLYYKLCLHKNPIEYVVNNNKNNLKKLRTDVANMPKEVVQADLQIACDLGNTIIHSIRLEDMKNKETLLYYPIANSDVYKNFSNEVKIICGDA